jgi:hypothetical protein
MSSSQATYDIDDGKSVSENISALLEALKGIDESLAAVLEPALAEMSNGVHVDQLALLDALYAATGPGREMNDTQSADDVSGGPA